MPIALSVNIADVNVKLFDTGIMGELDAGVKKGVYDDNVGRLIYEYNRVAARTIEEITDRIVNKMKQEIGVYYGNQNKVATRKFFDSIFKNVKTEGQKIKVSIGSTHHFAEAILNGQPPRNWAETDFQQKFAKGTRIPTAGFAGRINQWISKQRVGFYYWYIGPKVGRKLKRMKRKSVLFLAMRSIAEKGVLPSYRMFQKPSRPEIHFSKDSSYRKFSTVRGVKTYRKHYRYRFSEKAPQKRDYYMIRGTENLLIEAFRSLRPELERKIADMKGEFISRGLTPP